MSANQTTNLGANEPIRFNQVAGNLTLTSFSVRLKAGRTYRLEGAPYFYYSNANYGQFRWRDVTNGAFLGVGAIVLGSSGSWNESSQHVASAVVTPATDIDVQLWNTRASPSQVDSGNTWAFIQSLD